MMGHREKLKTGAEWDVTTGWRHVLCWCYRPRAKHSVKRQMSRRARREAKALVVPEDGSR